MFWLSSLDHCLEKKRKHDATVKALYKEKLRLYLGFPNHCLLVIIVAVTTAASRAHL